ncbi:DUF58 domain-containing protein [Candidatus Dependentiae bacterium]|nr:DUF58 domain-containing protein [Candidatus Dependentiae bacterium]
MILPKIAQQIKELEIHTKRILNSSNLGGSRSRQRGFGFEFDQLRSYQYGDDVRLIDWKNSAKMADALLVRQYFEERNRTFIICLDISASTFFGTAIHDEKNALLLKQTMMQQISGVLALAAEYSKDKVGLILFSDRIEKVIPPKRGKAYIHNLIETIFTYKPQGKGTNLAALFEYVASQFGKNAIVFVVSDFIESNYEKALSQAVLTKEVIAISCVDKLEIDFAAIGLLWMLDPETNRYSFIDARKYKNEMMKKVLQERLFIQKKMFHKHKIDFIQIQSKQNFIHDLILFFQKRLIY